MEMIKHPETRSPIAVFTIAVLIASAWTPAFAASRMTARPRTAADPGVHRLALYEADGNPLDRVGIEHNVYLGCLMRNGGDTSGSQLQRVVEECGFKPDTSTDEFAARYSSLVETDPFKTVAERMGPYRDSYTDYQFSFFERIDRVIATAQDQAEADAMFAQLEKEASARLTTDTAAEQSIFAALSTARHSLEYWSSQPAGSQASAQKLRWWVKVLAVVGADLLGAAGGTLIGGPVVGAATGSASSAGAAAVLK
jgi:hypothetical protein